MPVFSTRKALLVLNMQNDSFERHGDMIFCEKQEFRHEIDKIISHFRQMGDIVWIKTELDPISVPPSSTPISDATVSLQSLLSISTLGPGGSSMEQMNEETAPDHGTAIARTTSSETGSFHRKLKSKTWETDEDAEAYLKNTKIGGAPNLLAVPGTHGAELIPEMQAKVNLQNDLVIIKNRYSAFDGTQLLLSLRIKLVTHLYLTGCLTNISIYATAADAVRHGFEVTLVEDCLGYKSEDKHVEAMCKMADLLGVSGIDSNELIEEARDSTKTSSIAEQQTLSGTNKLDLKWTRTRDEFRDNSSPEKFISALAAPTGKDDTLSRSPFMIQNPLDNMSINKAKKHRSMVKASKITLGSDDKIGEGDSRIIFNVLSQPLAENSFTSVFNEVKWQIMRHRNGEVPRRVAVQGEIGNHEAVPLYRHPADESPPFLEYSPTVRKIRDELQILLKQPFNHCLIQLYRDGQDNISEHSDKVLFNPSNSMF